MLSGCNPKSVIYFNMGFKTEDLACFLNLAVGSKSLMGLCLNPATGDVVIGYFLFIGGAVL